VRWSFLLFVFTIALEAMDLPFLNSGTFSIARLSGLILFGSYFFYHNPLTGKSLPAMPRPLWWFLVYLAVYLIHLPFVAGEDRGQFTSRFYTMVQLCIFFWVASSLLRSPKMTKDVLWAYAVSWFIVAAGLLFNLPGFAIEEMGRAGEQRLTVEGYNPNGLAIASSVAVLSLIGLFVNKQLKGFMANALVLSMIIPLVVAIAKTGSRGGAVVLAAGFVVFLLPIGKSSRKVAAWLLAAVCTVGIVYFIATNPGILVRWEKTYYEGDTAGRQNIVAAGAEMILERPLLGWGYTEVGRELAYREMGWTDRGRDAHNLILHLLLEVGVVGTIPFIAGMFLCARAAWKARQGFHGMLPLAILATMFASVVTGNLLARKVWWLVLALVMGAESQALGLDRLRRAFAEGKSAKRTRSSV
jgi:O-antigen ligase